MYAALEEFTYEEYIYYADDWLEPTKTVANDVVTFSIETEVEIMAYNRAVVVIWYMDPDNFQLEIEPNDTTEGTLTLLGYMPVQLVENESGLNLY